MVKDEVAQEALVELIQLVFDSIALIDLVQDPLEEAPKVQVIEDQDIELIQEALLVEEVT